MKKIKFNHCITAVALLVSTSATAQTTTAAPATSDPNQSFYYVIGGLLIIILFMAATMLRLVKLIAEQHYHLIHGKPMEVKAETEREDYISKIFKSLTASVPKGIEKDVMLEHNYDGIRELDNRMPPWLRYIFLGTVCFAAVYLLVFQVYHIGKNPTEEYAEELKKADAQKATMLLTAGSSVDESTVKLLTDAASLSAGKIIFLSKCAPCHGQLGEGNVGPNLTDDYWLHGGTVNDIFKTVRYGVPSKGMVSWNGILNPEEMAAVASYITTLHGSNPPNAKAPQGVIAAPQVAISDSSAVKPDTSKTKI